MKSSKHIRFLILLTLICLSSIFFVSAASADPINIVYVTDVENPFPLGESITSLNDVSLIICQLPKESATLKAIQPNAAEEYLVFIDVRSAENFESLADFRDNTSIDGTFITFTKDDTTNIFSAAVESSFKSVIPADNETAAKYWSRHPDNLKNLVLWSANNFCSVNLAPEKSPIDITNPDNRTSVLLLVTPNAATFASIFDEASDYGIDLKFGNLTALTNASRDPDVIPDVLKEIDAFEGDIILEIAANDLNAIYLPNITAAVNAHDSVAIMGVGLTLSVSNMTVLTSPDSSYTPEEITAIKNVGNYWVTVLPENLVRMFIYMSVQADGRTDLVPLVKDTMDIPKFGIYHPDAPSLTIGKDVFPHLFDNRSDYNDWYLTYKNDNKLENNGQWIAISSYFRDYQEGKMHTEDMMIRKLEAEGYNVIVFYHPADATADISSFFSTNADDKKPVDVFIHFETFGYNAVLNKYGAPVLGAVLLSNYSSLEEWQADPNGLKKSTFYYKIDQAEVAGSLFPVGVEVQMTADDPLPYPIEDRVDRILGQAKGYANLRHTPNEDKKVALIYFNHPPGKQNVGASYFDLFGSLEKIFTAMKKEGYEINNTWTQDEINQKVMTGGRNVGGWAPGELEKLVDEGLADGSVVLLPVSTYEDWVSDLSPGQQKIIDDITAEWGAPGASGFMTVTRDGKRCFVLPVIYNSDNVIMAPEPARGWEEDIEKLYHDMNIPVPHQYAAFYLWLQMPESKGGFGADAMVHLGRHGTQEFLPGKMINLDESSAADLMIGDVPNIYPYIVDGSGEALQAKRRGYATLISHLTPPIAQSGLYGELADLNEVIVSYERAKSGDSPNVDNYKQSILNILGTSTIVNDLGIDASKMSTDNEYFEESLEEITEYLEVITQQSIPYGTHVFGESLSNEKLSFFIETIYADRMYSISCDIFGIDSTSTDYADRDKARQFSYLLPLMIVESSNADDFISAVEEKAETKVDAHEPALTDLYNRASATALDLNVISEMTGLINALDGKYIETSPLGDPIRNEEVLPTGRNMVGFVSNRIPTLDAENVGIRLADEMISAYYDENGVFPEKIGVVLWSVETFRHDGVMEAMAIHLMGGKIKRTTSVNNTAIDVIPEADLKVTTSTGEIQRPRVDVVFTISGLYRDTLPYQIRLLDTAVRTISTYEGDADVKNHVLINSLDMKAQLNALSEADKEEIIRNYKEADPSYTGGLSDFEDLAAQLSRIRIFGPPPESYGTGIEKEIEAGQGWDADSAADKIAELYIFRMANMYTVNNAGDIIFLGNFGKVFEMNLKGVEIVTNSRSSNLYGILDNDDFFQYVGGMSVAVQSLDEKRRPPQVQIVDLRVSGKESLQSLENFLKIELRARALNDKYLEGMINSGYSGMKEISELVDNLWGWQVTTPHAVGDYMWDDVYTKLVTDPTVSDAFKESNPYAYQSMLTRMIDANAKGYWSPSEAAMIQNLAKELAESVVESGVACCHHTCGNPTLNNHIAGILSIPGVVEDDVREQWQQLTESATNVKITPTGAKNTGKSSSGTGLAKIMEAGVSSEGSQAGQNEPIPTSQDPENSGQGAGSTSGVTPGQSVVGYEMTVFENATNSIRDFLENPTFSATSVFALLFTVAIVGALFYGVRRKGM